MGQFKALAGKNWILYKRGIVGSVIEILLPIIFVAFVLLVRKLATVQTIEQQSFVGNNTYDYSLGVNSLNVQAQNIKNCSGKIIAIAPEGNSFATQVQSVLSGIGLDARIYSSNDRIDQIVRDIDYGQSKYPFFCFGVSFVDNGPNYKYKLRFNITTNRRRSDGPYTDRDITTQLAFDSTSYGKVITSKMAATTSFINSIIAGIQTGESYSSFSSSMVPIYQQDFVNDPLYTYTGNSLEFLVLLPLLVVYLRQTSAMLEQKQKKIRQSMSIMGMKLWLYYLTWFIRYFIIYLIIHLISSAILIAALPNVSFGIIFSVFILFDILLIIQSFFIQTFFVRSKLGVVIALLFFIIQYVINYIIATTQYPSVQIFRAVSIVPHVAYVQAFKQMIYAESNKVVLNFTMVLNYYTIATALVSIALNIIFWGLLTIYFDQVIPNQWGAKKHPCFCFMCCCNKKNQQYVQQNQNQEQRGNTSSKIHPKKQNNYEIQSVEGKYKQMDQNNELIRIDNLVKNFDDVQAVKDLNLKIYKDQIFALLGHNGAGKTTTISMITGMLQPSHGSIQVLGQSQIEKIRENIGICPQHDTLYDELTVAEHIELFATFRGLEGEELQQQVDKLIKDVNLEEKKDQYAKNLSGGQKRRLSVAMAFSGGSKVIVLDQPTSGMDTSARRYIWQMLKNYKNDRIILLTTHFMDEADYLGDRIAIMAKGKLVTCGSNVFLKNKYGVGYNIVFVKKSIDVKSQNIIESVRKHVISAKILSDISLQLSMQLPLDTVQKFSGLFNDIDSRKDVLGIQTYGISITTLEQVFLKVGQEGQQEDGDNKQQVMQQAKIDQKPRSSQFKLLEQEQWERQDGTCERFFSHLSATILKRIRVIKRDFKGFLFELILPIIIIILALMLMTVNFIKDSPDQQLNYDIYYQNQSTPNPIIVPIGSDDSAFLSSIQTKIDQVYGNKFNIKTQTNSNITNFDKNFLYPQKSSDQTLKGGIYFTSPDNGTYAYKALVNTRSPTSVLTVQTLAIQSYMNYLTGNTSTITIENAPFPRTFDQLQINNTISGFFGALIFSIALSFKFASIVSFIVKERVDKGKHQQIVSGMNLGSYWVGNFLYDYLLYALVAGISLAITVGLNIESLIEGDALAATGILFFIYGLTNIPLTYVISYLFKDYGNAQSAVYFFNFVAGGILPLIILVLRWIGNPNDNPNSADIGRGIAWVLRIIPAFCFGEGMINLGSMNLLSTQLQDGEYKPFDLEITLAVIIYLVAFFFINFGAVFLIQYIQNNEDLMRCCSSQGKIQQTNQIIDSDVLAQQQKALKSDPQDYQILTKNLRKVYILDSDKQHKVAVDNLSFGVQKGQVFGLLGVNGAGKTTTFKILAGQIISTSGDSYFNGYKISQNLTRIRKNLGYCPQFDALIDNLTVREQLQLFYDMKCLPARFKQLAITQKIDEMSLQQYEDKLSGTLSGGNKRKLSVAMAMIGNPSIIFLDEPSTGMDPKARRFMWKVISRISTEKKQSTVILTTHSMEQAEALSTRLGIMVNGNFKCIGTPQHIKSRYGKGFEIEVKLKILKRDQLQEKKKEFRLQNINNVTKKDFDGLCTTIKMRQQVKKQISKEGNGNYLWKDMDAGKLVTVSSIIQFNQTQQRIKNILQALQGKLGESQIIEQLQTYVRFKTGQHAKVGQMFDFLQSKKDSLFIQQYSIKQVTVQQIFNRFAEQDENYKMD